MENAPSSANVPAGLTARVQAHLSHASQTIASVSSIERLAGGACQDNFALVVRFASGPLAGEHKLVLRSDAVTSLPGSLDRAKEYAVIRAAAAAGVRTPAAQWLAKDLVRPGSQAYFLAWAEGEAIGRRVVGSPKLAAARAGLAAECAHELARIHAIRPATHPDLFNGGSAFPTSEDPVVDALGFARSAIDALHEPRPALELAMRWLRENPPARAKRVLVHGDFRTGNFLVTDRGLSAVLDWEFSHWGAAAEDIAWLCMRDWRFGQLKLAAGGFAERAAFYGAYARETGRAVDPREVHWWEIMGNVRWGVASLHQGERYLSGGDADIELIAVARRAVEMEYEALRLLDVGESASEGGQG